MKPCSTLAAFALLIPLVTGRAGAMQITQQALGGVYVAGDTVTLPVSAPGDRLHYVLTDYLGATVDSGTVPLTGQQAVVRPHPPGRGFFMLTATALAGGQTVDQGQAPIAIVPQPHPRADSPYGVMTHFGQGWNTDIIPLITKAGIAHIRDEQAWKQVEQTPGHYTFSDRLTGYMAALGQAGIDPLIMLGLFNPLYDDGQSPHTQAAIDAYAAYASAVVRHYAGQIHTVEIWNEYNGSFNKGPCAQTAPRCYIAMLKPAYAALKAEQPNLTVIGGAVIGVPTGGYFQRLFQLGLLDAVDGVVIHPYKPKPEGIEDNLTKLNQFIATAGGPKPIWATEFGDIADMGKERRDSEAIYLVRMATLLRSQGVAHLYWYLMRDYASFTGMGLVRDDNSPYGRYAATPAYVAYATMIDQLDGLAYAGRDPSPDGTQIYRFAGGGRTVRVAWSVAGGQYEMTADAPVRIMTIMGATQTLNPVNGRISIPLGAAPVYLIGA